MQNQVKLLYFLMYFIFIILAVYLPLYYMEIIGLNASQISFFAAISSVIVIFGQIFAGIISDTKLANTKVVKIAIATAFFLGITIFLTNGNLIVTLLFIFAYMLTLPLIDAISLMSIENDDQDKFAKIRMFGSIGAAFGLLFGGLVINFFAVNYLIAFTILFLLCVILVISKVKIQANLKKNTYLKDMKYTLKNKNFLLILIIVILFYGTIMATSVHSANYSLNLVKLSGIAFGILGYISIFSEAIIMNYFPRIHQKINLKQILLVTVIFSIINYFIFLTLYEYPVIIFIVSAIDGIILGMFIPAIILFIRKMVKDEFLNTAMSLYQMSIQIGATLVGFIIAFNLNFEQINLMYIPAIVMTFLVLIPLFFVKEQ